MGGRLIANVAVDGCWYGPSYPDAGDPPRGRVTNPAALADGEGPDSGPAVTAPTARPAVAGPPPKAGPGSSVSAWRAFATAAGVAVADRAGRDEIIAACEAVHVPTE